MTIASAAAKPPERFSQFILSSGREKIFLAADTNPVDFKIKIKGWLTKTELDLFEHIEFFYERGLKHVKCSDVTRDGVMEGPNFELFKEVLVRFPNLYLAASGGVRGIDDFKKLRDLGVQASVFGRAYYEGKISLKDLEEFISKG